MLRLGCVLKVAEDVEKLSFRFLQANESGAMASISIIGGEKREISEEPRFAKVWKGFRSPRESNLLRTPIVNNSISDIIVTILKYSCCDNEVITNIILNNKTNLHHQSSLSFYGGKRAFPSSRSH